MDTAMKPSSLFFLLSSLLLAGIATADTGIVLPACKTVGGGSKYFTVDFCVAALGSDARSGVSEDYKDLALIAVDLTTTNATSTVAKINSLLAGSGEGTVQECLAVCLVLYNGIVGELSKTSEAINSGSYDEAAAQLGLVTAAPSRCEDDFSKRNVASLLSEEDDNALKLGQLAMALLGFA